MSLEVTIYGPGFGETIFLRWPRTGGGWHGALVDAYSHPDGKWLAGKLRDLELTELEFVVATHPHLDHIGNLAAGLELAQIRVINSFYWPPYRDSSWMRFFERLAAQDQGGELAKTSEMIKQLFGYWQKNNIPVDFIEGSSAFHSAYSTSMRGHNISAKVIGPWDAINSRLCQNVAASLRAGKTQYTHRYANDVSLCILIEYGDAQIVLGGDMERINWITLKQEANCPQFRPCLVKVSHHGSENGMIDGMWTRNGGFFGGKATRQPIAVVTPWRQAATCLPSGDGVPQTIKDSGFVVYVTGQGGSFRYRNAESHVHVLVEPDNVAKVVNRTPDVIKI